MVERRRFLTGLAATAGVAMAGCNRSAPEQKAAPASAASAKASSGTVAGEAASGQKVSLFRTSSMSDYPVARGVSRGLFLTFEGLCGIALTKPGETVRVGLLGKHHHLATMKLHRDAVASGNWLPTTADDDYFSYALKGLYITIKSEIPTKIDYNANDIESQCPDESNWTDLGWVLDMHHDLGQKSGPRSEWWKDDKAVDAVFELNKGWLEKEFVGDEPIQFEMDPVIWEMPDGKTRALKQIVRYRLSADDVVLEARPIVGSGETLTLTLDKELLVYAGVKHFPLGKKKERLAEGTELTEAVAYYDMLPTVSGDRKGPKAVKMKDDCNQQSTPDCSCCPPAIYRGGDA